MKTFEEKFTAWVDGALAKEEAVTFEKENPSLYKERKYPASKHTVTASPDLPVSFGSPKPRA